MKELEIKKNEYLSTDICGYYHGSHFNWRETEVGYINTLKNDDGTFTDKKREFGFTLTEAKQKVRIALDQDLPTINNPFKENFTICLVPRSKCNNSYQRNQLLFSEAVIDFVKANSEKFLNGTDYILRETDTPTTHLTHDYSSVTVGITTETCFISDDVKGKNILLIDDLYTPGVNIIEDVIQALLDNGAISVTLYTIGKTV